MGLKHAARDIRNSRIDVASTMEAIVTMRNLSEGSERAQLRAAAIHVEHAIRNLDAALSKVTPR